MEWWFNLICSSFSYRLVTSFRFQVIGSLFQVVYMWDDKSLFRHFSTPFEEMRHVVFYDRKLHLNEDVSERIENPFIA